VNLQKEAMHAEQCSRMLCLYVGAPRYSNAHAAVDLQKEAVYGLTELYRDQIKSARLLANPGCYPTCAQV